MLVKKKKKEKRKVKVKVNKSVFALKNEEMMLAKKMQELFMLFM